MYVQRFLFIFNAIIRSILINCYKTYRGFYVIIYGLYYKHWFIIVLSIQIKYKCMVFKLAFALHWDQLLRACWGPAHVQDIRHNKNRVVYNYNNRAVTTWKTIFQVPWIWIKTSYESSHPNCSLIKKITWTIDNDREEKI